MPWLPPVDMLSQTRLRARFWPGVIGSIATFFQSHSSSSATSWARPVCVPCPISARAMRSTQVSSGLTTSQALISGTVPALCAAAVPNGRLSPSASPPLAAAEPTMNLRRDRLVAFALDVFFMALSSSLNVACLIRGGSVRGIGHMDDRATTLGAAGRDVDRGADALISAAAADVGHGLVDVPVGRLRLLREQRRGRHDLPRLAIAALGHVD